MRLTVDRRVDSVGGLTLPQQLASQLAHGARAKSEQTYRSIVGRERARERLSAAMGVSGSHHFRVPLPGSTMPNVGLFLDRQLLALRLQRSHTEDDFHFLLDLRLESGIVLEIQL